MKKNILQEIITFVIGIAVGAAMLSIQAGINEERLKEIIHHQDSTITLQDEAIELQVLKQQRLTTMQQVRIKLLENQLKEAKSQRSPMAELAYIMRERKQADSLYNYRDSANLWMATFALGSIQAMAQENEADNGWIKTYYPMRSAHSNFGNATLYSDTLWNCTGSRARFFTDTIDASSLYAIPPTMYFDEYD